MNFLKEKPSEALSADATHDDEVNASLPPALKQAVTCHLALVNESRQARVVQAGFCLNF